MGSLTMRYACLFVVGLGLAACGDDGDEITLGGNEEEREQEAACTATVAAGANAAAIQQALIDVQTNGVVCFEPGIYTIGQELSLRVNGVTLRGPADRSAVLDFDTATSGAQGLSVDADDFLMQGLHVKNTRGDGVRVDASTNVHFRNVLVTWDSPAGAPNYSGTENGAYALYPVGCTNVIVEDSEVIGSSDAGIYVGQSTNVIVRNNYVHGNVAGIEIENCVNSEVYGNEATDNTGGILVFDLPNLQVVNGHTTRVHHNTVYDNNHVNFARAGTTVALVPEGTGVMALAAKDVEIDNNSIADNGTTAVLIVSFASVSLFDPTAATPPAGFDPWSYDVYIHANVMSANGLAPGGVFGGEAGLAQLIYFANGGNPIDAVLWDGFGRQGPVDNAAQGDNRICVRGNVASTTRNLNINEVGPWLVGGSVGFPPEMPQNQADLACDLNTHAAVEF